MAYKCVTKYRFHGVIDMPPIKLYNMVEAQISRNEKAITWKPIKKMFLKHLLFSQNNKHMKIIKKKTYFIRENTISIRYDTSMYHALV